MQRCAAPWWPPAVSPSRRHPPAQATSYRRGCHGEVRSPRSQQRVVERATRRLPPRPKPAPAGPPGPPPAGRPAKSPTAPAVRAGRLTTRQTNGNAGSGGDSQWARQDEGRRGRETALRSRGGAGRRRRRQQQQRQEGGCGRPAGRSRGRWSWSAAASCSALWGCARPAHRMVSADCGAPAGHLTPGRGIGSPTPTSISGASASLAGMRPELGAVWGLGRGTGRARLCPGTVRDGLFAVSGLGSNQDGLLVTVPCCYQGRPHRHRVVVVRLPRFLSGTGSLPSLCPGTDPGQGPCNPFAPVPTRNGILANPLSRYRTGRGPRRLSVLVRDGVPSISLLRYWTGRALSLLPPPPHHAGPAPAHFPRSHPQLPLSLPSVASTPGVPRVPRSAPSCLQGFPGEPLIPGLTGSPEFTCRAGQWAPSRECRSRGNL